MSSFHASFATSQGISTVKKVSRGEKGREDSLQCFKIGKIVQIQMIVLKTKFVGSSQYTLYPVCLKPRRHIYVKIYLRQLLSILNSLLCKENFLKKTLLLLIMKNNKQYVSMLKQRIYFEDNI